MTQQTKIEWCDFTVNFWEGCQKVGPGCDKCYAEARDVRFTGGSHWGPGAPRRKVKGGIAKLRKINREADAFRSEHGRPPRVFCSSLSDVFDKHVDPEWRRETFSEIYRCFLVNVLLLTKRIGNVYRYVPSNWHHNWPPHVGLMITVVNQEEASRDIPKLLRLKELLGIPWVGLSIEPLLGPVDLALIPHRPLLRPYDGTFSALTGLHHMPEAVSHEPGGAYFQGPHRLDWVIIGGESGPNARPMHPDWARSILDQCEAAGTPALFKQWGEWSPGDNLGDEVDGAKFGCFNDAGIWVPRPTWEFANQGRRIMFKVGKKAAGRMIDGRTLDGFPEALL